MTHSKPTKNALLGLKAITVAATLACLLQLFAFSSYFIPATGMENSLYQGERILVNKWSYGLRLPFSSLLSYYRLLPQSVEKNDIVVFNNPNPLTTQTVIERREVYISRCVGIPGQQLKLNRQFAQSEVNNPVLPDTKSLFLYPHTSEDEMKTVLNLLQMQANKLIGYTKEGYIRSFSNEEAHALHQHLPTSFKLKRLKPLSEDGTFTLQVPAKDIPISVHEWNIRLLCNTINQHEGRQAEIIDNQLYVDGKLTNSFPFSKNYYWMVSNNDINLNDSRLFGFVPEDHIIGKACLVWFSKAPDTRLFEGVRWNRFFNHID